MVNKIESLLARARALRQKNFLPEIQFDRPVATRSVSVTGSRCALNCAHCDGHFLKNRLLSRGLVAGLRRLGVEVDLFTPEPQGRSGRLSGACFDAPSWYEVAVEGKKLVGSAQVRQQGVIMQHGSILLSLDEEKLFAVLSFPSEAARQRAKNLFSAKAMALDRVLPATPGYEQVWRAVAHGFAESFNIELVPSSLSGPEKATARRLAAENTVRWTGRSAAPRAKNSLLIGGDKCSIIMTRRRLDAGKLSPATSATSTDSCQRVKPGTSRYKGL